MYFVYFVVDQESITDMLPFGSVGFKTQAVELKDHLAFSIRVSSVFHPWLGFIVPVEAMNGYLVC